MALEFSTNVSLRDDDKDRYQFVYATQLYGTFFAAYGKFTSREDPNDPSRRLLERIDFIGINYKGPSTLKLCKQRGFSDQIRMDTVPEVTNGKKGKMIEMDLWLQADTDDPVAILDKPYLDLGKHPATGGDYWVKSGDYFRMNRKLERMNPDTTRHAREQAFVKGHFDSEFWIRDGLDFIPKGQNDPRTIDFRNAQRSHDDEIDGDNDLKMLAPTINCIPTVIKLIF